MSSRHLLFYTQLSIVSAAFLLAPLPFSLQAQEQGLKESDVHQVMQNIFKQHLDQKGISGNLLKNGFQEYINQFDPNHIYLLESEVRPYLDPTAAETAQYIQQYKAGNLSSFEQLNGTIRSAIERAQALRQEISKQATIKVESFGADLSPFATNKALLKGRILQDFNQFVSSNKDKKDPSTAFARYDEAMKKREAEYLGIDLLGKPLPQKEQENLFAMRILKALTSSLDAHSKFLDSQEAFDLKLHLEKEYRGIGVEVTKKGNDIIVNRLVEGGPAAKSGEVYVKDKILRVDGHDVAGQPLKQVLEWMRATDDATVELVLQRTVKENGRNQARELTVKLFQSEIKMDDGRVETSYERVDDGIIGRVILHSFYRSDSGVSSEKDVREAIAKLKSIGNLKGLILDLRDNTGGFLGEAVKVAGLFITSGIIVISKYSNGGEHIYRDVDAKVSYDGPLVILTSRETASAAEIVTQALQDYGIALVVGDVNTYGKGTIQSQTVTDDNKSNQPYFKVTVGKYYTVSGKTPQGMGVKADIVVPSPVSEMRIGEQFLDNTEPGGVIAALYEDNVKDVDPSKKQWYTQHYTPTLQKKVVKWRLMLPELQRKSAERIAQNKAYQKALLQMRGSQQGALPSFKDKAGDLQLQEANAIVKDMILMQR